MHLSNFEKIMLALIPAFLTSLTLTITVSPVFRLVTAIIGLIILALLVCLSVYIILNLLEVKS